MALEPVIGGCLLSPVELREIIDNANSWAVGSVVDADRVAAGGCVEDWVRTLAHRIHAVRLAGDSEVPSSVESPLNGLLDELRYDRLVIEPLCGGSRSCGEV